MEEILLPEIMEHIFEQFKYCSYCEPLKTTYHKLQTKCIEKNLSKCSKTCSRWSQIVQGIKQHYHRNDFSIPCLKDEKYIVPPIIDLVWCIIVIAILTVFVNIFNLFYFCKRFILLLSHLIHQFFVFPFRLTLIIIYLIHLLKNIIRYVHFFSQCLVKYKLFSVFV